MANSFWELVCAEHSIGNDGHNIDNEQEGENKYSLFEYVKNERFVPRSILIDLEPSVIDEVRSGPYRTLFNPDYLINGNEDSGGNFARGFYTVGKLVMPKITQQLRKVFESNQSVNGIIIFRSLGGGTGAGLTSALFDLLVDIQKITKIEVPIYPSPVLSSSVVEPYNGLLGEHFCMEEVDVGLIFDNEALFDICENKLLIVNPTFTTINHLICQTISGITANLRFQSVLNCDLNVIQTNLVPYPRIHFPISNFAPIMSVESASHNVLSVNHITDMVFDPSTNLISINTTDSMYMSSSLFYRGNVSPYDVHESLKLIKSRQRVQFVDWCPTGFKVSISNSPSSSSSKCILGPTDISAVMLSNNSAIGQVWMKLLSKFQAMYTKRAFMHWFVAEGLEENEFDEAQMNITSLVRDYTEVTRSVQTFTAHESTVKDQLTSVSSRISEKSRSTDHTEEDLDRRTTTSIMKDKVSVFPIGSSIEASKHDLSTYSSQVAQSKTISYRPVSSVQTSEATKFFTAVSAFESTLTDIDQLEQTKAAQVVMNTGENRKPLVKNDQFVDYSSFDSTIISKNSTLDTLPVLLQNFTTEQMSTNHFTKQFPTFVNNDSPSEDQTIIPSSESTNCQSPQELSLFNSSSLDLLKTKRKTSMENHSIDSYKINVTTTANNQCHVSIGDGTTVKFNSCDIDGGSGSRGSSCSQDLNFDHRISGTMFVKPCLIHMKKNTRSKSIFCPKKIEPEPKSLDIIRWQSEKWKYICDGDKISKSALTRHGSIDETEENFLHSKNFCKRRRWSTFEGEEDILKNQFCQYASCQQSWTKSPSPLSENFVVNLKNDFENLTTVPVNYVYDQ